MNIEKDHIKFIHYMIGSKNNPASKVELTISKNNNVYVVLNEFQKFLKDVGYEFEGDLTIKQK